MMDWREHAACRGYETSLFFPLGTSGPALEQIANAKAVCARCEVCSQCLEYALRTQSVGVWGAMDEDERRALRRRRQRQQ